MITKRSARDISRAQFLSLVISSRKVQENVDDSARDGPIDTRAARDSVPRPDGTAQRGSSRFDFLQKK
jgi:hypothetical protein